ncbi:MAG: WecB/TagA/CpsF family glycosyltransferase [Aeromicrobium sp.]|nr:WecB/TagA/CpsF family glycosyltransferase [Burkholderiales bacterium]
MKNPSLKYKENVILRQGHSVLGTWVDALFWDDAIGLILNWGAARESRYVCICNVHSVVTATHDAELRSALGGADLSTSDGAPIAWALRRLGFPAQERIAGPDLMWRYLRQAERSGQKIFLYGSTHDTLSSLRTAIAREFPLLDVRGMLSPPFRSASPSEDEAEVAAINASGANVVFVGLGCPKQEKWMAAHRGKIHAVMVGVGAAFDFHSGMKSRAPLWWQRHGLEWLYRLGSEPRRLLRRYLVTNTLFVVGFARQLIVAKVFDQK